MWKLAQPAKSKWFAKQGLTLLEVVIALFIFGLAILAIPQYFATAKKLLEVSRQNSIAINLARATVEEILAQSYEEISVGQTNWEDYSSDPQSPYASYQKRLIIETVDSNLAPSSDVGLKKITVEISWTYGGRERISSITSLKTRR